MSKMQTKVLVLKKFGWKRVARNTQRFGWTLGDATEEEEVTEKHTLEGTYNASNDTITLNDRVERTTKTRVYLSFYRYPDQIANRGTISILELFYSIIFTCRRIVGFFLPFLFVVMVIIAAMGHVDQLSSVGGFYIYAIFVIWALLLLAETILARVAGKILKWKD